MKIKIFDKTTMEKPSPADIVRMWIRLWGDLDPSDVSAKTLSAYMYGSETLDKTQE